MWKLKFCFSAIAIVFLFPACNRHSGGDTPEQALQEYINTGFSAKSLDDKKKLLDLSTGEAFDSLEKITDQDFVHQFVESKLRLVSLKTKDLRKEDNGNVSLIYEISFEDKANNVGSMLTNKKIAFLTLDPKSNTWKIKSTTNVKSLVERKEDLVVMPQTVQPPSQH